MGVLSGPRLADGINTVRTVMHKADQMDFYMPIVNGLYAISFEGRVVAVASKELKMSEQASDVEFVAGS